MIDPRDLSLSLDSCQRYVDKGRAVCYARAATAGVLARRGRTVEHLHELAELIVTRKGRRSYSELADRSGLSRAAIHRLTTAALRTIPDPDTLNKLAVALDVSIDRIAVAALRSAGVPVTDRFATGDVLEGLDQLTPTQRAAVEQLVHVMVTPAE
jgi:transcriptional regulator with XRE-family HTH domain